MKKHNAQPLNDETHSLSSAIPEGPEDRQIFRLAQLILLFEIAVAENVSLKTIDRVGLFDFLAANPFVVTSSDEAKDKADRLKLRLAGFSDQQISYASMGERFVSRRERLQCDVSLLIAYGLISIDGRGYELTLDGQTIAGEMTSMYADAYRQAAGVVLKRVGRMSDKRLFERANDWLGRSWLLVDFWDDIAETVPSRGAGNRVRRRH